MRFLVFVLIILALATSQSVLGQEPLPAQPAVPAETAPPAGELPAGQPPAADQSPGAGQAPAGDPAGTTPADQNYRQMVSYTLGVNFANNLRQSEIVVDLASLVAGITDTLNDAPPKYTNVQLGPVMQRFQQEMQQKGLARMAAIKRAGDAFLAENKTKPGVQVTPSGLQYRVIQKGDGPVPTANDTVRCHYRGTYIDGTEFDSSYRGGQPAEFPVTGVIAGWTEALQLMHVGDKWQLFIPSELAYGERGKEEIGPNEALIFEIELLGLVQ
jgi:FKBP-type peptidyl-prolyl cis-trans isomerase FklB